MPGVAHVQNSGQCWECDHVIKTSDQNTKPENQEAYFLSLCLACTSHHYQL